MKCVKCNEIKEEKEFYFEKTKKSGYSSWCKDCHKKENKKKYKTKDGVIKTIFASQISSSYRRCHKKPSYTIDELSEWLYSNGFNSLYDNWVKNDFKKDFKPSVDRLDDFKPYTFNNIRLVTWKDNREKQYKDFRENILPNIGYFGLGHQPVAALNNDGSVFKKFISMAEAARYFNLKSHSTISSCCNGRIEKAAGYKWRKI